MFLGEAILSELNSMTSIPHRLHQGYTALLPLKVDYEFKEKLLDFGFPIFVLNKEPSVPLIWIATHDYTPLF